MDQHTTPHFWLTYVSKEASVNFGKSNTPVTHQIEESLETCFPYGQIITESDDSAIDRKSSCWLSIDPEMPNFQGSQEILSGEQSLGHNLVDIAQIIHGRTGVVVVKIEGTLICQDCYNAIWRMKCNDARGVDRTSPGTSVVTPIRFWVWHR